MRPHHLHTTFSLVQDWQSNISRELAYALTSEDINNRIECLRNALSYSDMVRELIRDALMREHSKSLRAQANQSLRVQANQAKTGDAT